MGFPNVSQKVTSFRSKGGMHAWYMMYLIKGFYFASTPSNCCVAAAKVVRLIIMNVVRVAATVTPHGHGFISSFHVPSSIFPLDGSVPDFFPKLIPMGFRPSREQSKRVVWWWYDGGGRVGSQREREKVKLKWNVLQRRQFGKGWKHPAADALYFIFMMMIIPDFILYV